MKLCNRFRHITIYSKAIRIKFLIAFLFLNYKPVKMSQTATEKLIKKLEGISTKVSKIKLFDAKSADKAKKAIEEAVKQYESAVGELNVLQTNLTRQAMSLKGDNHRNKAEHNKTIAEMNHKLAITTKQNNDDSEKLLEEARSTELLEVQYLGKIAQLKELLK